VGQVAVMEGGDIQAVRMPHILTRMAQFQTRMLQFPACMAESFTPVEWAEIRIGTEGPTTGMNGARLRPPGQQIVRTSLLGFRGCPECRRY
jgi:hypothetical protein